MPRADLSRCAGGVRAGMASVSRLARPDRSAVSADGSVHRLVGGLLAGRAIPGAADAARRAAGGVGARASTIRLDLAAVARIPGGHHRVSVELPSRALAARTGHESGA